MLESYWAISSRCVPKDGFNKMSMVAFIFYWDQVPNEVRKLSGFQFELMSFNLLNYLSDYSEWCSINKRTFLVKSWKLSVGGPIDGVIGFRI